MAILLAANYLLRSQIFDKGDPAAGVFHLPCHTYIGVPMSILHASGKVCFIDFPWEGEYILDPYPLWDCARWLRGGMYKPGTMMCLSFHPSKHIGISTHGGAILLDDEAADAWLRCARFDGRMEILTVQQQERAGLLNIIGYHAYMNPITAAEGLERLSRLPYETEPLPNSDYPDLSQLEMFK
jgi:hypothetical protein